MFLSRSKFNSGEREGRSEMIYILFLHNLVHFFKFFCSCPRRHFSLEQWALQPHRDQCHRHTFSRTIPHISHPSTSHTRAHTQIHTHSLLSCRYFDTSSLKGSSLKRQSLPRFSIPYNSPCHLYLKFSLALALPHPPSKLTGDTMMPQTQGCMAPVKQNALATLEGILSTLL